MDDDTALLRRMCLIREFETRSMQLYNDGEIKGAVHSSAGQEAVAVGICSALGIDDYVASNHRGHGHAIAKGARVDRLMAELMGRETGYCRGKGGSMHVADFSIGMLGANGIVGASAPIACGAAYSSQVLGNRRVAVAFFGDGALAEGVLWESVNLAALWKLPVIFVLENNQYAVTLRVADGFSARQVIDVPQAFQVPSVSLDGMSLHQIRGAAIKAAERARTGEGPSFIEAVTYRFGGHSRGDPAYGPYRTKAEWEEWTARDPIQRFAQEAHLANQLPPMLSEVAKEIDQAVQFGRESPFPALDTAFEDLYPSGVA